MELNGEPKHAGGEHAPADHEAERMYARCLEIGTLGSLAVIVLELAAYLSGLVSPYIPLRELPAYWGLPLKKFLEAAQVPAGWGWLALVGRGDYLNFVGIALLASISFVAFLCVIAHYAARRDRIFVALAVAQALVLLAAASGLLNSLAGG